MSRLGQWWSNFKAKRKLTGLELEKQLATNNEEPFIKVVEVAFDADDPTVGSFELDWNSYFVDLLVERGGYSGRDDVEIVDQWMNDLCAGVAQDLLDPDYNADSETQPVTDSHINQKQKRGRTVRS